MAIKPMLFNTEMVRAILSGQKTQTRRVVKPQPNDTFDRHWESFALKDGEIFVLSAPYKPGDILYVRETWNGVTTGNPKVGFQTIFWYKADDKYENPADKWRPSIHMPKEAARIFLRVTDVRVERLQGITIDECKKEGIWDDYKTFSEKYHENLIQRAYPVVFAELWDSTIKPADLDRYGWAANPWVWVIEFERCEKPEESLE